MHKKRSRARNFRLGGAPVTIPLPQPLGKPGVANVWRSRPGARSDFHIEYRADCLRITLVVHRVRSGERAVDVENGKAPLAVVTLLQAI
jgi:hypothetical protein